MLLAIGTGFLVVDAFLPDEYKVSLEESAESSDDSAEKFK
jgi:hypothetical protein